MADKPYRSLLGCMMWGQAASRPDILFAVGLLPDFSKTLAKSIGMLYSICVAISRAHCISASDTHPLPLMMMTTGEIDCDHIHTQTLISEATKTLAGLLGAMFASWQKVRYLGSQSCKAVSPHQRLRPSILQQVKQECRQSG